MAIFWRRKVFQGTLLASLALQTTWGSMVVSIQAGSHECFYTRIPSGQKSIVSGNYDLLDDEASSELISAWLEKRTGPNPSDVTTVWKSHFDEDEDSFSLSVDPDGKFGLCFQVYNKDDDFAKQSATYQVGFNLRVTPVPRSLEEGTAGPDAERALELVQSAVFVENDWKDFIDHFDYLRSREASHTTLMHQIRDRVLGWTVVEAILVITMAVVQILYWRRFFETRRYL
ncbi:hypothetical protein ACA910_021891 [Epithemia clementina (nom. ined.)]